MVMRPSRIELHIEELILHGFPPAARHHIGDALVRELTRLLTEEGVPPSLAAGGESARLNGGTFQSTHDTPVEAIGAQIARAVYGGLGR
jgi:hypothetical protein